MDGMTMVEVYVVIDENGDVIATHDADKIGDLWEECVGPPDASACRRIVKVTLTIPTPKPIEMAATVAAEPAAGELKAA
jgi:hypothetical protein